MKRWTIGLLIAAACAGQTPVVLTLDHAKKMALANHPAIEGSRLESEAARERVNQFRSAWQPGMTANLTAVGCKRCDTRRGGCAE